MSEKTVLCVECANFRPGYAACVYPTGKLNVVWGGIEFNQRSPSDMRRAGALCGPSGAMFVLRPPTRWHRLKCWLGAKG